MPRSSSRRRPIVTYMNAWKSIAWWCALQAVVGLGPRRPRRAYEVWLYHLPRRRPAQRPERRAADQVGNDRRHEGEPIAAGHVEDPSGTPGAHGRADAGADRDHTEDRAEVRARKEIRGLRGDRRAARAPRETEEARMDPEEPGVVGPRDEESADHADDRDHVGEDGRELAA